MLFFFLRAGGKEGWVGKLNVPGQGGGGVVCVLNKYCDLPFFGLPLEQSQCSLMYWWWWWWWWWWTDLLSVNWGWQPTSCMFHCNIVSGQNVHCWGTLAAESYIIMSHTTNKAIISKHHNDYYTLQTLELTGKTWCVQHVHQLWAFTLS